MFGISIEHLLIAGVILLVFGPKRLPQAAASLGKAVRNFKEAVGGIREAEFKHLPDEPTSTSQKKGS